MNCNSHKSISNFFVAGVNYKKTNTALRGMFAINTDQYSKILTTAAAFQINDFFILSTCNRTEIFGFANNASDLIDLLCSETTGAKETFNELAYVKSGNDAVTHLFNVGGGLDSQILGDYEVIGQLKQAVNLSKKFFCISPLLERLVNFVIQASKSVKNKTLLSTGTVSVSFAAVQYIKENIPDIRDKKILLVGVGKIGKSTCKNIVDYLDTKNITLVNRSVERASELAAALDLHHTSIEHLALAAAEADVILVATSAPEPAILKCHLENKGRKLVIDLSVPNNVENSVKELDNVSLINVDELSQLNDKTLKKRKEEIPVAKKIIELHIAEFMNWYNMRQHVPVLKAVKVKLNEIYSRSPLLCVAEEKIQQVINGMAFKMRSRNQQGCYYIEAINEFIK